MSRVLVTGGAGFIGSFLVDRLIERGNAVRILDNLEPQIHFGKIPSYLNKDAEFIKGDVTNYGILKDAIKDIDVIFHEAAAVGIGQSMYQIQKYVAANSLGTAVLLSVLVEKNHGVKKLITASSFSVYGEGSYKCEKCGLIKPKQRNNADILKGNWELKCPDCGSILEPIPTNEEKKQEATSIYALTKRDQEDMCMMIGKTYGIPTVALRYFNVYGQRQSLSNPYTGVTAIFMSRIKNNKQPIIYEDGLQTRDFISVHDIVDSNLLAMSKNAANYETFNVGTGNPINIMHIAETVAKLYEKDINPSITYKFRKGDIRHCFADITKIRKKLGFKVKINFEDGMKELIKWSKNHEAVDKFNESTKYLKKYDLI